MKFRLLLGVAILGGMVSADGALAQIGCALNIRSGKTAPKIHFVSEGNAWTESDWSKLQAAAGEWTSSCTASSVIPKFHFKGAAGSVAGAHVVKVSRVTDAQMDNPGACGEASRRIFRINDDANCTHSDLYTHEVGHVLGLPNTTMTMCRPANGNAGSIMWVGVPRHPRAITSQTCNDVRRARKLPNPGGGGGGGGHGPGGATNPGGGSNPGEGGSGPGSEPPSCATLPGGCPPPPPSGGEEVCVYQDGILASGHENCPESMF